MSNFFLDCEFIDDGRTIDLISIALVHESRASYYAVSSEYDESKAGEWVRENVLPHIATEPRRSRAQIRDEILAFVATQSKGKPPIIWGWYASYDWVAFCQLWGTMIALPPSLPRYIRDLKMAVRGITDQQLPKKPKDAHNALRDAQWAHEVYRILCGLVR